MEEGRMWAAINTFRKVGSKQKATVPGMESGGVKATAGWSAYSWQGMGRPSGRGNTRLEGGRGDRDSERKPGRGWGSGKADRKQDAGFGQRC